MNRQRRLIALLAGSLLDGLWFPSRPSGVSGLSGGRKVPCPGCSNGDSVGSGWVTDRWRRRQPCEPCAGLGFVRVDDYDRERRPIRTEATPDAPAPMITRRCDACWGEGAHGNGRRCVYCGGSGGRSWPVPGPEPDEFRGEPGLALVAAIERRREAGDYRLLELALDELRARDRHQWRVWVNRWVDGDETVDRRYPVALELGWRFIVVRMPAMPRVPASVLASERERRRHVERLRGRWADKRALGDRNQEIRRRFNHGEASVEELIRTFGCSRSTVYEAIHGGAA